MMYHWSWVWRHTPCLHTVVGSHSDWLLHADICGEGRGKGREEKGEFHDERWSEVRTKLSEERERK